MCYAGSNCQHTEDRRIHEPIVFVLRRTSKQIGDVNSEQENPDEKLGKVKKKILVYEPLIGWLPNHQSHPELQCDKYWLNKSPLNPAQLTFCCLAKLNGCRARTGNDGGNHCFLEPPTTSSFKSVFPFRISLSTVFDTSPLKNRLINSQNYSDESNYWEKPQYCGESQTKKESWLGYGLWIEWWVWAISTL